MARSICFLTVLALCSTLCVGNCSMGSGTGPVKPTSVVDDEFVETCLRMMHNKDVFYDNEGGKLILYAHPKLVRTALWVLASITNVGLGVLTLKGALLSPHLKGHRALFACIGALLTALGGGAGYLSYDRIKKHFNNIPYLTFDAEGLWVFDVLKFRWNQLEFIEIETSKSYYRQGEIVARPVEETKSVQFRDGQAHSIFLLSTKDDMLPVPVDSIVAFAKHYQMKYGNCS